MKIKKKNVEIKKRNETRRLKRLKNMIQLITRSRGSRSRTLGGEKE